MKVETEGKLDMYFEVLYNKNRENDYAIKEINKDKVYLNPGEKKEIELDLFTPSVIQGILIKPSNSTDLRVRIVEENQIFFEETVKECLLELINMLVFEDVFIKLKNRTDEIIKFDKFKIRAVEIDEEFISNQRGNPR